MNRWLHDEILKREVKKMDRKALRLLSETYDHQGDLTIKKAK